MVTVFPWREGNSIGNTSLEFLWRMGEMLCVSEKTIQSEFHHKKNFSSAPPATHCCDFFNTMEVKFYLSLCYLIMLVFLFGMLIVICTHYFCHIV